MSLSRIEGGQSLITIPLKALGFKVNLGGMCHGISLCYITDDVLGKREHFINRIELIRTRSDLIADLQKFPLNPKEQSLLTFFKEIQDYQFFNHCPISGLYELQSRDIQQLPNYVGNNLELKAQGGLIQVYFDELMYTPVELCGYFEKLRMVFQESYHETGQSTLNLSVYLSLIFDKELSHGIVLSYDAKENRWILCDPNLLPPFAVPHLNEDKLNESLDEWKKQPKKAIQHSFLIKILLMLYETQLTSLYICGCIQVMTIKNHSHLSTIKKIFENFKKSEESFCAPLEKIITRRTIENRGIIHLISEMDDVDRMKQLIEAKADLNLLGNGFSPLFIAAATGSLNVLTFLTDPKLNIDLNQFSKDEYTAAFVAAKQNRSDVLKILIKCKAEIQKPCFRGKTPFHVAAQNGNLPVLQTLLNSIKIDLNCMTNKGLTPVYLAALNNQTDVVEFLALAKANLMQQTEEGCSPLFVAAKHGAIETIKILLNPEFKVDVNQETKEGLTAALAAATTNQVEVLKLLVNAKGNIYKAENYLQWAPFHIAAQLGHIKILEYFLEIDAEKILNKQISTGESLAFIAAGNNHPHCLTLLAESKADLNLPNQNNFTALHYASYLGNLECVKVLIKYRCNVLQEDNDGHTAFFYAINSNNFEIALQLINSLDLRKLNKEDEELNKVHRNKLVVNQSTLSVNSYVHRGVFGRSICVAPRIQSSICVAPRI